MYWAKSSFSASWESAKRAAQDPRDISGLNKDSVSLGVFLSTPSKSCCIALVRSRIAFNSAFLASYSCSLKSQPPDGKDNSIKSLCCLSSDIDFKSSWRAMDEECS